MIRRPTMAEIIRIAGKKLFGRDFDRFIEELGARAQFGFEYDILHVRGGLVIDHETVHNIIPTEGLHHILNTEWRAGAQVVEWYMGIFSGNYSPVLGDTMATFPALATEVTAYVSSTRPTITFSAPSAGNINNTAARCSFVANHPSGSVTWRGGFISSNSAKSATTGTLSSAARFNTDKTIDPDDTLLVGASLTMANP